MRDEQGIFHSSSEAGAGVATGDTQCPPRQWCGSEAILLVEDEAFVRKVTAEVLASAGYTLVIAASAAEALEAYRRCAGTIDLLLADVVMPGMNGRELATKFESLLPHARVLLMTGHAEQLLGRDSSPYDQPYLKKPFCRGTLLQTVREVLDANSLERTVPA